MRVVWRLRVRAAYESRHLNLRTTRDSADGSHAPPVAEISCGHRGALPVLGCRC